MNSFVNLRYSLLWLLAAVFVLSSLSSPTKAFVVKVGGSPNWDDIEQVDRSTVRWTFPASDDPDFLHDGLGGGLFYSVGPRFCDQMKGQFDLEIVTCDEILAAVKSALSTWSENHSSINFHDVSQQCTEFTHQYGANVCPSSGVEILIDTYDPNYDYSNSDMVTSRDPVPIPGNWAAVTNYNVVLPSDSEVLRRTSGEVLDQGFKIQKTYVLFNTSVCWFLDQDFCAGLFPIASLPEGELAAFIGVLFTIWLIALLPILYVVVRAVVAHSVEDRLRHKLKTIRYLNSWHTTYLSFWLAFIIIMPVVYYVVYLPCANCYHFESTMAHEIGHCLGLTHPNSVGAEDKNWVYENENGVGEWNCIDGDVSIFDNLVRSNQLETETLMTTTQNKELAETCLTEDEMGGLTFLYPCGNQPAATCHKPDTGRGIQRTLLVIFLPLVGIILFVNILIFFVKKRFHEDDKELAGMIYDLEHGYKLTPEEKVDAFAAWHSKSDAHRDAMEKHADHDDLNADEIFVVVHGQEYKVKGPKLQQLRALYQSFHPDDEGHITGREMLDGLRRLGYEPTSKSLDDLKRMGLEHEDDLLSFTDFITLYLEKVKPPRVHKHLPPEKKAEARKRVRKMRKIWDRQRQPVTHEHVPDVLIELGYQCDFSFIKKVWTQFDVDVEEALSFEEFMHMYIPLFKAQRAADTMTGTKQNDPIDQLGPGFAKFRATVDSVAALGRMSVLRRLTVEGKGAKAGNVRRNNGRDDRSDRSDSDSRSASSASDNEDDRKPGQQKPQRTGTKISSIFRRKD